VGRMQHARILPPSLDILRGFESAARHLSFTGAGRELFVTQSAISRQIRMLEEHLGVKLFERRSRAIALTKAGEAYYREIAVALQQLSDATARVRATNERLVRVTTTVTVASLWLVPRLALFQRQFPSIPVHVHADNTVVDLRRGRFDVALRYTTAGEAGDDAVLLFGETIAPVCSPALIAGRRVRAAADLLRFPLLHYEDPRAPTPWLSWEVWLETLREKVPVDAPSLSFSNYDQVVQAAIAGQGVALGRFPFLDADVSGGRLVKPLTTIAASPQNRAYWLLLSDSGAERAEVRTFVDWIMRGVKRP
jgi:LysR family glycine cleavage system transcriptional activator